MDANVIDWVLYLRKSKGRSGISRQRTITTAHIGRIGGRVAAEFTDTDRTAFRKLDGDQPKRDGFGAMLAMLRARPGLGVAAWHADRLTRNSEDTETLIKVCAAGGHLVETPRGGAYDLATATGRKRLRDDANDAAYEVDHMTERIAAMKAEHAAAGRWLGGRRPFGYEPDGVTLRVVEAGALAQAHRDLLDGATLGGIARGWNARAIPTTTGGKWRGADVGRVLKRARNAGLMEHQGQITGAAQWPPIVDETTWRATVAVLADPGRRTTPGPGRRHLLTFIARCGVCGGPVLCTSTSRDKRTVYRCREDTRGHVARDKTAVDDMVTRLVIGRLSRPDAAGLLVPDHAAELAGLHRDAAAIRELMAERDRLHRRRVITTAMLVDGMRELQAELDAVDVRIAAAGRVDVLAPLVGDPAGTWAGLGLDQRRAVVDALMSVTILPAVRKGRPAGWRPGQPYFDPGTIRVEWRRKLPGEV